MILEKVTYEKIILDIQRQNYVEVPLTISSLSLDRAAQHFLDFLTLPQEVKNSFRVIADEHDRGSDSGYARKLKTHGDSDSKEYFNYRGLSEQLLKKQLEQNRSNPNVQNFFQSARGLFSETSNTLEEFIKVVDRHYQGIHNKIFSKNPGRLLCLRFVKYDSAGKGGFLATGHYDRGACAFALAESAPGLRVGKDQDTLTKIMRQGNMGIFMPAYTFNRDTDSQEFPPAWHDVVQESNDTYSKDVARWAIILFADVHSDHTISYQDTHTPF